MAQSQSYSHDKESEDEIFFGKLTLKEIKRHIRWKTNTPNLRNINYNNDIRIIETHSEPDINKKESNNVNNNMKTVSATSISPNTNTPPYSNWEIKAADDSFLKVEKMVNDLCISHESEDKINHLDNTLDIDYILKSGSKEGVGSPYSKKDKAESENTEHVEPLSEVKKKLQLPVYNTPVKNEQNSGKKVVNYLVTPITGNNKDLFNTPRNPLSQKKASATSLRTPGKSNAYQHIASPVASYIKNYSVAPPVKDVKPVKPLAGTSSIPKLVRGPPAVKNDCKENIGLPSIAYKSAKKTRVIDEEKVPQKQCIRNITSSLPRPVVLKHNHREINCTKRNLGKKLEDSFGDLSLHQADVSVCTQMSAFNKSEKPL